MNVLVISNQLSNKRNKVVNPVIKNLNKKLNKKSVIIHEYPVESEYGVLASYISLFLYLIKLKLKVKEDRFDIYHVHFGGVQGLITSLLFGSRTLISFHGTDLHGGSPVSFKEKIKSKIIRFSSVLSVLFSNQSTVVSENLIHFIPKRLKSKVVVIPTGVNKSDFKEIDRNIAQDFLGIKNNYKYFLFSDISHSTVKRRDLADEIIISINKLGVKAKLLTMNQIPYNMVPYYIYASDFLLITSDKEGSPNIVKEALFCDVGVISTDVGDVGKYVKYTGNGFIFESIIPEHMAKEILEFLEVDSKNIHNYNKDILSLDYIAVQYLDIYDQIK